MAIAASRLLALAESLPETGERDYGDATVITFRGRGIAYVSGDGSRLVVKATLADREALVRSEPDVYSESWSSGRFGWVAVDLSLADPVEVGEILTDAWRLTAPKRLVGEYDATKG